MQKFIIVEGKKVSFTLTPPYADPSSSHLLFLHGLQSQKEAFYQLQQSLSSSLSFPQLAIDLIGFGHSDKPKDFTYDIADQARIIIQILNALHIIKVHIIGHSLGGMIGTLLLKESPDLVGSLCSMEGNLALADCGESKTVADMSFDHFAEYYFSGLKTELQTSAETSAPFRYAAVSMIPDFVFYKTAQSIVHWSKHKQLFDIFNNSVQPKLLVRGDKSNFASSPTGPNIQKATISRAKHFMHFDNPAETAQILSQYLKNIVDYR